MNETLEILLRIAAAAQILIAIFNLFLVPVMGWKKDLEKTSLLVREVFMVHIWFIAITLGIFGALTWRFCMEMAAGSNPACLWLAGGISIFYGIRAVMQVTYYSSIHWKGQTARTFIHIGCLLYYGGLSALYAQAAWRVLL